MRNRVDRAEWIEEYKLMLGGSRILRLEVDDNEMNRCIDIAYKKIKPFITDVSYITVPYQQSVCLKKYNVEEVMRIMPTSRNILEGINNYYMFDWQIYQLGARPDIGYMMKKATFPDFYIPFQFDNETQTLYITEGCPESFLTIEVVLNTPVEKLRDDRAIQWIYSYALALIKEVIGRIRSKATSGNVPIELDGDTLLSEAQSERSTLEEQLQSDAFGPVNILR